MAVVAPRGLPHQGRIARDDVHESGAHLDGVVRGVVATQSFILLLGFLFLILELVLDGRECLSYSCY